MITKDQLDVHLDRLSELLIDGDLTAARAELETLRQIVARRGLISWPYIAQFTPIEPHPRPPTEPHAA